MGQHTNPAAAIRHLLHNSGHDTAWLANSTGIPLETVESLIVEETEELGAVKALMFAYTLGATAADLAADTSLTVKQLAGELQVSTAKVYRLANSGHIPSIRVGRSWRFDLAAVKKALNASRDPWANPHARRKAS